MAVGAWCWCSVLPQSCQHLHKRKNNKRLEEKTKCPRFFSWTQNRSAVRVRAKGSEALLPRENEISTPETSPCGKRSVSLLDAVSVSDFKSHRSATPGSRSLVDVPDFREQRGKLLVLEAKGEDLLRVDAAQSAEAHQLHQHAGEHQVILRKRLKKDLKKEERTLSALRSSLKCVSQWVMLLLVQINTNTKKQRLRCSCS